LDTPPGLAGSPVGFSSRGTPSDATRTGGGDGAARLALVPMQQPFGAATTTFIILIIIVIIIVSISQSHKKETAPEATAACGKGKNDDE
jgi:hypothetical protein